MAIRSTCSGRTWTWGKKQYCKGIGSRYKYVVYFLTWTGSNDAGNASLLFQHQLHHSNISVASLAPMNHSNDSISQSAPWLPATLQQHLANEAGCSCCWHHESLKKCSWPCGITDNFKVSYCMWAHMKIRWINECCAVFQLQMFYCACQ